MARLVLLTAAVLLTEVAAAEPARFDYLGADVLPGVVVNGESVIIHSQGLYVTDDHYLITGRCESQPKRALLLRLARNGPRKFEYVDITPAPVKGQTLDHPGGFDVDASGKFWIPLSTSNAAGPSLICRYNLEPNQPLSPIKPEFSFEVDDHIGAVCRTENDWLMGANWDTKHVYVWSTDGTRLKKLARDKLFAGHPGWRLAVQDWKFGKRNDRDWIVAGGLDKTKPFSRASLQLIDPAKAAIRETHQFSNREDVTRPITNEGLAWHEDKLYLLPEDIGRGAKVLRYQIQW